MAIAYKSTKGAHSTYADKQPGLEKLLLLHTVYTYISLFMNAYSWIPYMELSKNVTQRKWKQNDESDTRQIRMQEPQRAPTTNKKRTV